MKNPQMMQCRISDMSDGMLVDVDYIGSVQWQTPWEGLRWFDLYLTKNRKGFCYRYDRGAELTGDYGTPLESLSKILVPEFYELVKPFIDRVLNPDPSVSPGSMNHG